MSRQLLFEVSLIRFHFVLELEYLNCYYYEYIIILEVAFEN